MDVTLSESRMKGRLLYFTTAARTWIILVNNASVIVGCENTVQKEMWIFDGAARIPGC